MVLKRQLRQGEEGGSELPNKRRHFTSTLLKGLNYGWAVQESSCLEPILRKMVRESVQKTIDRYMRPSCNRVEYHASRSLQLQFHSELPDTIFTINKLVSKDKLPIKLALYDSVSREIIACSPLSSLKVTIVVLDGDFGPDDLEEWPAQEFDTKLVKPREGKRPLVAGETTVNLENGVGYIGDLVFTDNSKWSRSGKFRLGAKANLRSADISIREAVSNAFRVKDHRGEALQKHHPPALDDEVWRLEKIAKDGILHKKLKDSGILTVRDFLRQFTRDEIRLREILVVSSRIWDTIKGHATKCILGVEKYVHKTTQGLLFFNSIHEVVGVNFDGVHYHPANTLDSFQMRLVDELKQQAYNNLTEWIPVSDPSVAGFQMLPAESFTNPNSGPLGINFQEQDQNGMEMNILSPHLIELGQGTCSYHLGESSHSPPQASCIPTFRNSISISDPLTRFSTGAHPSWGWEGNYMGSQLSTDNLPVDDPFQLESSAWQWNEVVIDPGSPKTKWCKVLAVVKWRILVRRNVAAKKWNKFYYNYV